MKFIGKRAGARRFNDGILQVLSFHGTERLEELHVRVDVVQRSQIQEIRRRRDRQIAERAQSIVELVLIPMRTEIPGAGKYRREQSKRDDENAPLPHSDLHLYPALSAARAA